MISKIIEDILSDNNTHESLIWFERDCGSPCPSELGPGCGASTSEADEVVGAVADTTACEVEADDAAGALSVELAYEGDEFLNS